MTLKKGKTKGILPIHNSCALIQSSNQQNRFRKRYLLCTVLNVNSGNDAVCGGETRFSRLSVAPKPRSPISNRGGFTKSRSRSQKMFSRVHSQTWLLAPITKGRCSPAANVNSAIGWVSSSDFQQISHSEALFTHGDASRSKKRVFMAMQELIPACLQEVKR